MITPRQPRDFFTDAWQGTGCFQLHSILRWFVPDQAVEYDGRTTWLSDTLWMAKEKFHLSQAGTFHRTTFIQIVESAHLHMTCDDVPGGADIHLNEYGFRFTPYRFLSPFGGITLTVKCMDEAKLDEKGILHDHIEMYYSGINWLRSPFQLKSSAAAHGFGDSLRANSPLHI